MTNIICLVKLTLFVKEIYLSKKIIILMILFTFSFLNASEWLGKDKFAHLTYSAFLSYWSYGISKNILRENNKKSGYISLTIPLSLGVMKEYSDKKIKKTGWSWQDLTYDVLGVFIGTMIIKREM